MPYKSRRHCASPGCPTLISEGMYCEKHKKAQPKRESTYIHYGRSWEKLRVVVLARHPLCVECENAGRLTPAKELHHIIPVSAGGTNAGENLMPLCKSCHTRKTMEERSRGRKV